MRAAVVIVSVALLAIAAARCPNSCSGHGDCGGSDKCTCWPNWQGFDCAERTCEFDVAWATDARQNPHYYAECSGKGICDRTTGLCTCFDGYTGSACRRSACPNDCSGHGKCRLIAELPEANSALSVVSADAATEGSLAQYTRWDGDKIQACVCDGGFFGPDCSQRYCPKGDDPLTICNDAVQQVQTLEISSSFATAARTKQQVLLTPGKAGLPIKGKFDLAGGAGFTAAALDASSSTAAIDTALSGTSSVTGASPAWTIDTVSEISLIAATSNVGNPLYSPTGAFQLTADATTFTITVARTESGTAVEGAVDFSLDAFTTTATIDLSGGLAAAVATLTTTGLAALNTALAAGGFAALGAGDIVGTPGSNADEGVIVFTAQGADVPSTILTGAGPFTDKFDDVGTDYSANAPTLSVAYVATSGLGSFNALTSGAFRGELVLHFTDSEGEVWTTTRIGDASSGSNDFFAGSNSATQIQNALAAIPNFKVPAVTVASAGADTGSFSSGSVAHTWDITFKNERNSGTQNLLACDPLPLGCQTAGCSPMYKQPKTWSVGGVTPSSWTAHYRVEYARTAQANAFGTGPWIDSVTGGATFPSAWNSVNLATTMNALLTADSIFDNSGLAVDQATVLVRLYKNAYSANGNWGAVASDRHVYYTVEWDYTSKGVGTDSALPTSTCGLDGHSCASASTNGHPNVIAARYIPTGKQDGAQTAKGLTDSGVGFDRVPIGNGLYINLGDALAGLSSSGTNHEQLYIAFDVATVRCSVTDVAPAPQYEHLECSGRGTCDRSTGTCTCFEGHYGDHCAMQTILV